MGTRRKCTHFVDLFDLFLAQLEFNSPEVFGVSLRKAQPSAIALPNSFASIVANPWRG
jgi:hypothetical protein